MGDATYWQNNWVWFRVITQTFLRSVGGPHDLAEICADLTTHDSFIRPGGWLADGARVRKFDHYNGWALQLYPTLWSRMVGADDLAAERRDADLARLDRFLQDAVRMVGADGAPMIQGRSLTYRFATAAPFWVGAIAGVPSVPLGQLRRAATMQMDYFRRHGAPDPAGLLGVGWFGPYAAVAQDYSGPASPYWASKGLLGIAMPADHPVWLADEVPLPIEQHDSLFSVAAAGWLVSATKDDGIVRLVNHGTDGADEGSELSDAPGYSRLGYSTSTSPLWDRAAWERPGDSAVVLLDAAGRATHRTGMRLLDARVAEGLGVAASTGPVRWMTLPAVVPGSGPGLPGGSEIAGQVTLVSVVRGPWEVRAVRVAQASPKVVSVQVLGWPLDGVADADDTTALVRNARFTSLVRALTGGQPGVSHHVGASPLAEQVAVPSVTMPLTSEWQVALVVLAGPDASTDVVVAVEGDDLRVEWPDGEMDQLRLGFGTPLP